MSRHISVKWRAIKKLKKKKAIKMPQWVKVLAVKVLRPEFKPQNLVKGKRRKPTSQGCPLTFSC